MRLDTRIDELIDGARRAVNADLDSVSFQDWKKKASGCLADLLGPDHTYTRYFNDYVQNPEKRNILAGGGILEAAKEALTTDVGRPGEPQAAA